MGEREFRIRCYGLFEKSSRQIKFVEPQLLKSERVESGRFGIRRQTRLRGHLFRLECVRNAKAVSQLAADTRHNSEKIFCRANLCDLGEYLSGFAILQTNVDSQLPVLRPSDDRV